MVWTKKRAAPEEVRAIADRFGVDLLCAAVLARRGTTAPEAIRFYLDDDLRQAHSPFCLPGMSDAVDRIMAAVDEQERVLVFGDRDVDGITSITLLVSILRELGLEPQWALPMADDPYGLTNVVIDRFADQDGTLIIAVDCGTTAVAEIAYANERAVDVVVVDHHNPGSALPQAVAIVNPKLPGSAYPFNGLCAVALTAKLGMALQIAKTTLYHQPLCLLNLRPGNNTIVVEALRVDNLAPGERLVEHVVPGVIRIDQTRLVEFLAGHVLFVYDRPFQERLLREAFGAGVDFNVYDVADDIWTQFPTLKGRSLLKLREGSRLALFSSAPPEEIDVFYQLFASFAHKKNPGIVDVFRSYLDLVALGTVSDMMPIVDENRLLVKVGLEVLQHTPRVGLRELLIREGLAGKSVKARDLSWQLGPLINSTGRMGHPDRAVELLLNSTAESVGPIIDEVVAMNAERKRSGEEAWVRVFPKARDSLERNGGKLAIVRDDSVHRGITGILAGRLCRDLNAPVMVVASTDGRVVGSVRSVRGFLVTEFLAQFADLLTDWGGHDAAGGFHLPEQLFDAFVARVEDRAAYLDLDDDVPRIAIDAEVPQDRLTEALEQIVDFFAPFGQANAPLTFLARDVQLSRMDLIGKTQRQHLKLLLSTGVRKWPALYWNAADRANRDFAVGDHVDVVFQLSRNVYQGVSQMQMIVADLVRSADGHRVIDD